MKRRRRPEPKPRRRRRAVIIPLASMGDIAFLLLFFLIVSSEMIKQSDANIERAQAENIEEMKERAAAVVTMDADGIIRLDRNEVEDVELLEAGVAAMIDGATSDDGKTVMVLLDKSLTQTQFLPVWEAVINAGARLQAVGEEME